MVSLDVDGAATTALFGVLDGHAGGEAARFCARHVAAELAAAPAYGAGDLETALSEAFLMLEGKMKSAAHREELACLRAGALGGWGTGR